MKPNSSGGVQSLMGRPTPLVIGHRGCPVRRPENTMASFALAVEEGADMIELDVQLSADGQLVVLHDQTLERTTNGAGLVAAASLAQLRALDAGAWFGAEFAGERPPTLAEVFEAFGQRVLINVEIKAEALCLPCPGPAVVRLVLAEIARFGLAGRVLISCMSFDALRLARVMDPAARLAVLTDGPWPGVDAAALCLAIGAVALNCHIAHLDQRIVERLHQAGLAAMPYVDGRAGSQAMARALELGCDGFFADDPKAWREMIGRA